MINTHSSQPVLIESDPSVIRAELARLLSERRFSGAPQMSAFLRYIVQETLDGNADRIKAFSVGVDALGKPDTFDAQTDPSVRVLALRLRKTLAAIYEDTSGCLAIIDLKVGTYVPTFYKPVMAGLSPVPDTVKPAESAVVTPIAKQPQVESCRRVASHKASATQDCSVLVATGEALNHDVETDSSRGSAQASSAGGSSARSTMQRTATVVADDAGSFTKWVYAAAAILLIAAWQIAASKSDVQAGTHGNAGKIVVAHSTAGEGAGLATTAAMPLRPTIVVRGSSGALDVERKILLMLTSSFMQAGTVNVIKQSDAKSARTFQPGEYQLYLNGYSVEDEVRVDTQIVRLSDGQMLFAKTVILEDAGFEFSAQDLGNIESLASGIASVQGPVYEDYCTRYGNDSLGDCSAS